MKEIRLFYFSARQSTHPSAFLAVARGTPDYQAGDSCHHTAEDEDSKNKERRQ